MQVFFAQTKNMAFNSGYSENVIMKEKIIFNLTVF